MQKPFPSDAAPLGTEPAEDCLVLNVWRPAPRPTGKLPVMVWIYGGGFVNGGSSPAVYDGSQFASRASCLGELQLSRRPLRLLRPSGAEPGAARAARSATTRYMDQIAALKWVKRNIGAFGGDPDDVTVFGESAGGMSVHMMLTSPDGEGPAATRRSSSRAAAARVCC